MPYIETIAHEDSEGELKSIYNNILKTRGKLADVHMIQSLNPKSIVNHMDLYMTIMFGKSPLKRVQREMMAVVVSSANNCDYCILHHAEAVNHYWKNEEKLNLLKTNFEKIDFSEIDLELCRFAKLLTIQPNHENESSIKKLKELGLSDRAILDGTMVVAYFNFVNRIVLGLGLDVNEEEITGYEYE